MEKVDASFQEQLVLLRDLTRTTGVLHDAQVLQLKLWPLVAVPHATASEFVFNWEDKEIDFRMKVKGKAPKDLQKRLESLDESVKFLLGDDYLVRVRFQGKVVYRGPRKAPVKQPVELEYDRSEFEHQVFRKNFEDHLKNIKELEGALDGEFPGLEGDDA